ncbi:MAG TPA: hypothetical protein VGF95_15775 [Solirubrobacteraceae bacterium]|jgi:hypothetical protein
MASESIGTSPPAAAASAEQRLPPITEIAVATLIAIVAGGIYLAAKMPGHVSLPPAIVLLALGAALLLLNVALLSRIRSFAWHRFSQVYRWTLLAYVVIAGMLEYVFVYDEVRGGTLIVLSGMLLVFALNVPLVLAFTVARFTEPS